MLTFYLYVSVLTLERYEESFQYSKKTFLFQGSVLKSMQALISGRTVMNHLRGTQISEMGMWQHDVHSIIYSSLSGSPGL